MASSGHGHGHGQQQTQRTTGSPTGSAGSTGTSDTWDFTQRETFGRLIQRATEDAWLALDERWPDDMPEDGNLAPLAEQLTWQFLDHSQSTPRWAFTSPDIMRFYRNTIGNFYYWFALHALGQLVSNRVQTSYRIPPRTTPLPQRRSRTAKEA